MPRATTAAWLVMPPRVVRMPRAACMPWMSSGLVSMRTRMTASPLAARISASSALNTTTPQAAPGLAGRPWPNSVRGASGRASGAAAGRARRVDAHDRLAAVDQAGLGHLHGDAQAGGGGALAVARLQHVQLVLLHGELDVLHVVVVRSSVSRTGTGRRRRRAAPLHGDFAGLGARLRTAAAGCGCRRPRPRPARSPGTRRRTCSRRSTGRG